MIHENSEKFKTDLECALSDKITVFAGLLKKSGFEGDVKFDEQLSGHTTFKIGGAARVFLTPTNIDSLFSAVALATEHELPYFVLGGGSNVVFADDGFAGVVISTKKLVGVSLFQAASQNPQLSDFSESGAALRAAPSELNSAIAEKSSASRAASEITSVSSAPCETDCLVRCGAGASMAEFVSFCTENALSGAEEFAGLPGSVGGAVFMNARCFDKSVSDILVSIEYIDAPAPASEKNPQTANVPANGAELRSAPSESVPASASPHVLSFSESEWGYKKSPFQNTRRVITAATFRLRRSESEKNSAPANASASSEQISPSEQIASRCAYFVSERKKRGHFDAPSAGSVFKNDRAFGVPSGKLVDDAGLRGTQIGGAQIAPWHGNFIINTGGATAADVRALVDLATEKVKERTGFTMESEIIFVNYL